MSAAPADIFDEVFALLTPQRVLSDPRATGAGVKIGVIDSGVDRDRLAARCRERGQEFHPIEGGVFREDRQEPLPDSGRQSSPHGTTVADIILTIAPGARLYSADVFGPMGSCQVAVVVRTIRWAMDVWGCKILNLSLGIPEAHLQPAQRRDILRAIEEAYYRDVLVCAAAHNEHPLTRSYPSVYSTPLVSVDKGTFDNPLEFAYKLCEQVEFQAHGQGYLGPFATEPATSWATPHLAGIAARILSLRPELKPFEMKTILYWLFQSRRRQAGVIS